MPWKEAKKVDERAEFVIRALQRGKTFSQLCLEFGISRPTGYLWFKRYCAERSLMALDDRSKKAKSCPHRTASSKEERVVQLRQQYGWGAKKIHVLLKQEAIHIPISTINRILNRHQLMRAEHRVKPKTTRFERPHPNDLWQMDFKGYYEIQEGKCHPFCVLDDHSRYALAVRAFIDTSGRRVWLSLLNLFHTYGVPKAMLMDHGTPWWGALSPSGLTWIAVALIKQDIDLIYCGLNHPQTQGKIERFHWTLASALLHGGHPKTLRGYEEKFDEIKCDYNDRRPHEALGMQVPASRYRPSEKAYNPKPKPWVYPSDAQIVKVKPGGVFRYEGRDYHLTQALMDEWIAIRPLGEKLLIQYRNMFLKEINLHTGEILHLPQRIDV